MEIILGFLLMALLPLGLYLGHRIQPEPRSTLELRHRVFLRDWGGSIHILPLTGRAEYVVSWETRPGQRMVSAYTLDDALEQAIAATEAAMRTAAGSPMTRATDTPARRVSA